MTIPRAKNPNGVGRTMSCPVCSTGTITEDVYKSTKSMMAAGKEAILQSSILAQSSHPELMKSIVEGIQGDKSDQTLKWLDPKDCMDGVYYLGWSKYWNRPHFVRWNTVRETWILETGAKGIPTKVTKVPLPNLKE